MKKIYLIIYMALLPLLANADVIKITIDRIHYELSSDGESKTASVDFPINDFTYSGSYVIPSSVTFKGVTYIVTSIKRGAFYKSNVTSVFIPNSVTSIGDIAFEDCSRLEKVVMPNRIDLIGNYAFSGCKVITSVSIPDGLTKIGKGIFMGCCKLPSITIPNSVTSIGESAFSGCSSLSSVMIPNSVTEIGKGAFENCSGLTSLTISNSVTSIDESTFSGCSGLSSVMIPNSVVEIGTGAFENCSGLTSLMISNSVTSIGESTFSGCSGLTSLTIPSSITSIGNSAFSGCSGLTSFTIPSSITSIGNSAFSGCSGLTSLTIPSSITSIGNSAFSGCSGLTSLTILSSITSIGNSAFSGCSGLTSLTIPSSITSIGNSAFSGCSGLTSLTIPNSVTSIGNYAFANCSGLSSVMIPNSVNEIGACAFENCSGLTSLTIGKNVKSIYPSFLYGCSALVSIVVDSGNTVYDSRNNCNAIIEKSSKMLILGCNNTIIPYGVAIIGDSSFYGCTGLTSITIPNSVNTIGSEAFSGCTGLTSITIPNSVNYIGYRAFLGCTGLTSITIPNSVNEIGSNTFSGCTGLTSITIPNSVNTIGREAFYGCSGLSRIVIQSDAPPTLGDKAFYESDTKFIYSIKNIYVPADKVNEYKNVAGWNLYADLIKPIYEYPILEAPAPNANLFYTGVGQTLISTGLTDVGTLEYSSDGIEYSIDLPLGTDAKEYTIYYRYSNDVAPKSINVTILPKTVSNPTIILSNTEFEYDGNAKEPIVTIKDEERLIPESEYTTVYSNNTNVGNATVTISDKDGGNYIVNGSMSFPIYRNIVDLFDGSYLWACYVAQDNLAVPIGLAAYVITNMGASSVTASEIDYIPQGVPVLLKRNNTTNIFQAFAGTGIGPSANLLKVYDTDKIVAFSEGYVLYKDQFVFVDDGILPAGRIFLPANGTGGTATRSIVMDGEDTTRMYCIRDYDGYNENYFDLLGRKLIQKPVKKGLYILNGRKIIVK